MTAAADTCLVFGSELSALLNIDLINTLNALNCENGRRSAKDVFNAAQNLPFTVLRMTAYFPLVIQLCIGLTKTVHFASRHLSLKDKKSNRLEQMRGEKMTNKLVCCSRQQFLCYMTKKSLCGVSLLICLVVNFNCGST